MKHSNSVSILANSHRGVIYVAEMGDGSLLLPSSYIHITSVIITILTMKEKKWINVDTGLLVQLHKDDKHHLIRRELICVKQTF